MAIKNKEGHWLDSKGDYVPERHVKPEDKRRDKLVSNLVKKALKLEAELKAFKADAFTGVDDYIEFVEDKYDLKVRTKEGNKTLSDYSNTMKVEVRIDKQLEFDEKLQLAKTLIDECINRWVDGSRLEIKTLIQDAFKVDKKGTLDRDRILGLRKLNINDSQWKKAMDIISDSLRVIGTRAYIRVQVKDENGFFKSVNLDIARV